MGRHISQPASATPYDNTDSGASQTDVKAALDYLFSQGINFSFKRILTGEVITVQDGQQMIVFESINIDGSLVLDGELCLILP